MKIQWLATSASGGSSFSTVDVPLNVPARRLPARRSHAITADSFRLVHLEAGFVQDWHQPTHPLFVVVLAGTLLLESSDHGGRRFGKGDGLLVGDREGIGHRGVAVDGPVDIAVIRLTDDFDPSDWAVPASHEVVTSSSGSE